MSNFIADAIHPRTKKVEQAEWLDNHFGRHRYGIRFPDGSIYQAEDVRTPNPDVPSTPPERP